MDDPTQVGPVTDHDLVESVFDAVAALRDEVVEKSAHANAALRQLRATTQVDGPPGTNHEVATERFAYTCPGCDGRTRGVSLAFQRGEACPICGLGPDVVAAVVEARSRAVQSDGQSALEAAYPLVAFLVARSLEADDRNDPTAQALAHLVDRVIGWPRRDEGRMWQRDEDLLRIAAAAYAAHPDYDRAWSPT